MVIRPTSPEHSFAELTALLHRAYAPLAASGFRFYASHQSEDETRERAGQGTCFVAEEHGALIGTIVVFPGNAASPCAWYRNKGVWVFGQFAVEPTRQHTGIGAALLAHAEGEARRCGAQHLACDTAEGAEHLITYYTKHGFSPVGFVRWDDVNYRSIVLSKPLS